MTEGDAARTAKDVLASSSWFRLGIAALVVVVILDVVVAWALLTFFEPVHRQLALLAARLRLAYAAVFAVAISQLAGVLPLLREPRKGTSLSTDRVGYLVDSFVRLLVPGSSVTVSVCTFVGEALFMLWLLAKGRRLRVG